MGKSGGKQSVKIVGLEPTPVSLLDTGNYGSRVTLTLTYSTLGKTLHNGRAQERIF